MNPEIEVEGDEELGDTTNTSSVDIVIGGRNLLERNERNKDAPETRKSVSLGAAGVRRPTR